MLRISSIDSESKQRFLRLSRRIQSGQLSEPLKCPKTVEFRPVLILKLASKSLFRWYGDVEGISKPAWAMLCNNFKTVWSVECSIGSRWFLWSFWVVNTLFNLFFRLILASIFVSTTCWSSRALVSRNHTCIFTLNTSIKWCLWQAFSNNWQNLEETGTNGLGPIIYRVRWGA